jgi:hypothetical protein
MSFRYSLLVILALSATVVNLGAQGRSVQCPEVDCITLEQLRALPADSRLDVFERLSHQKKAAIVREHLLDWKQRNADTLDSAQVALFDEIVASVTADAYIRTKDQDVIATRQRLLMRAEGLFTRAQIHEAFFLGR